jgi:hypothetical protein
MILEELQTALSIAGKNLLSIPVLAFALGVLASRIRSDLRLPEPVYQAASMILLLAIGLKGGVALRQANAGDLLVPILVTIGLGIVIPLGAFFALKILTPLGRMDRGSIAAHYGSTSLVTFTAALVLLESVAVRTEGYVATLLTVMEIPGIVVGLLLATAKSGEKSSSWRHGLAEVLTSKSVLLLVGGLALGAVAGPEGYTRVEPLFGGLFQGILTLFLLHLGAMVGTHLAQVKSAGWGLLVFAIGFPVVAGVLGVLVGTSIGMDVGGATVLGVLCGSASYIAAPAAVRIALPEANETIALTSSLAITFPFNLTLGIPLLLAFAQRLAGIL